MKKLITLSAIVCACVMQALGANWYVDQLLGYDSYAGSAAKPKKTIQGAINACASGDVIYVAPGTYAPITVPRAIKIIGTKGARHTIIDGALDTLHKRKYRCAEFAGIEDYELIGFTLQNGYSDKAHGGGAWQGVLRNCIIKNCSTFTGNNDFGGGGAYKSHLYDCIVENCRAGFGGAISEALAHRCTFRNNYARNHGGALYNSYAHQSLLHDNYCDAFSGFHGGGGAHASWLYNCTVTRNIARRLQGAGGLHACYSYNCIVWANQNPSFPSYHNYRDYRDRQYDHFNSDPRFISLIDFHLRHDSPCRRIGNPAYWYGGVDRWDRDRNPRFHSDKIDIGCYQEDEKLNSVTPNGNGTYTIKYNPLGEDDVSVSLDGITLLSSSEAGEHLWQPQTLGNRNIVFAYGESAVTSSVNVTSLPYAYQKDPTPPMPLNSGVVISPATRNVKQGGNGYTVNTTGSSANWTAAVSDDWIKLTATSGNAGMPVAYTVGLNTNAEKRVGYVYVSGHVHTITQPGCGATIDNGGAEFECEGGEGSVNITIAQRHVWKARPNCDWITVINTNGMSSGTVRYKVAPLHDVTTRSGEITIGENTFTVFQYGRRMGLDKKSVTKDYYTHVIDLWVNALAITVKGGKSGFYSIGVTK